METNYTASAQKAGDFFIREMKIVNRSLQRRDE